MRDSSSSASMLLPFGSLMGDIPIDAISSGRVLGDFSNAIDRNRFLAGFPTTPNVVGLHPACTALPPSPIPSGGGGISPSPPRRKETGG